MFFFMGGVKLVFSIKSQFDTRSFSCLATYASFGQNPTLETSPGFPMVFLGLARLQLARSGSQSSDPEGCFKGQPGCPDALRESDLSHKTGVIWRTKGRFKAFGPWPRSNDP